MIRTYRKMKKITQKELAEKLNVSQGYISKLEKGHGNPTLEQIIHLADALGISAYSLASWLIDMKLMADYNTEYANELGVFIA
ncbi:MerR family transcriptional regulator [[Clostridium] sordellii]|uniref:MerR family transcriptional regulator n=1 Tax=Paraclostridium sordellii TaxID=1505 RepID=A0A0C7QKR4_PARSO|nr:helix-turn-helix transcriptional regulator [Paeniclostridium sordellii]CEQ04121.1 MerR family transcriptional regulator [[Clostridium] sordellii] [Paeniclostridium sordellii]